MDNNNERVAQILGYALPKASIESPLAEVKTQPVVDTKEVVETPETKLPETTEPVKTPKTTKAK